MSKTNTNSGLIRQYLEGRGYTLPDTDSYARIKNWLAWYGGCLRDFHRYTVYNGTDQVEVERLRLGMAKTVCEDHANLLLNEKVTISAGTDSEWLDDALAANNFRVRGNNLVELAYALGTGALVEYKGADDAPIIDYIRADMIYPLAWEGGEVRECAFASLQCRDKRECFYIQIHRLDGGSYTIENVWLDAHSGGLLEAPEGVEPTVRTGSAVPLFQLIRPNVINNFDPDSPLGISIYGNAIDQLKSCDLVYDSYMSEFILGRKRIIVPVSMAKIELSKQGVTTPVFDAHDTVFYAYQAPEDDKQGIHEIDITIRAAEHETGLNRALDALGKKCGLGNNRYKLDSGGVNGGVKTATEVISEKSELYQNLKKNELVLGAALRGMVVALGVLTGHQIEPTDVEIGFDDSIIEDSQAVLNDNVTLVGAGLKSKLRAIMDVLHLDEAAAQEELDRINEESTVVSDAGLDYFGGGDG